MRQRAGLYLSVSTWKQPLPRSASPARRALVELVAQRVIGLGEGRLRIGIDGRTAAGKTSLGHELADRVCRLGRPVLRASLDDFKKPWRDRHLYDRESGEGYYRNAFDYTTVTKLLLDPFDVIGPAECALCSIDPLTQIDQSSVRTPVPPDGVLIVDGVFAFRSEIDRFWDLRIWVDVDAEISIRRGTQRDHEREGAGAEALHRHRYLPAEQLYLIEVDPRRRADVVVDNSNFDKPRLL